MKTILNSIIPQPLRTALKDGLALVGPRMESIPQAARIFAMPGKQVFFGYYDVSPFSGDDTLLLAQQAPGDNVSPHKTHPDLTLGYYDLREKQPRFHSFGATKTWNWQQGCRLQWYGGADTRLVIYNTLIDGQFGAVIQDALTAEIRKIIMRPVYAVSPDGSFALSLDFARLHRYRRGYGYSNVPGGQEENVIRHINLRADGAERTIMDIGEAAAFRPLKSMQGAQHYFNHLSISPSGKRYMVTHLWLTEDKKRHTRILVGSFDGAKPLCPDNSGHTSHYCWVGDDCVIIFSPSEEGGMGYHLYDLNAGTRRSVAGDDIREDGHPSWRAPGLMITDTYPDFFRLQKLLEYDEGAGMKRELARFYMPPGFTGEMRCDLHPRLSHSGLFVCVDMVTDNRRALCVFPVQRII